MSFGVFHSIHYVPIHPISKGVNMFKMSNEVYDVLKEIALTILPALAVFYTACSKIWGLPYGAEIPATIMAVDALLGACLHISTSEYRKGGDANV